MLVAFYRHPQGGEQWPQRLQISGNAVELRVEVSQVAFDLRRRIAVGIDADE